MIISFHEVGEQDDFVSSALESSEPTIDQVLFVSIHFSSDQKAGLPTDIDEPILSAGRLKYKKSMTAKTASKNYDYYMCKYWFFGEPHPELEGWRRTIGSKFSENLDGSETFVVPLYDVTSSEKLKELVIDPLLKVAESLRKNM
ncbi:MAG: hypothetical protein JRG73_20965 [Deltaproteobacteria bacterium]|nr:hypothetical protein [Deltaproteobacteria bacterium]